MNSKYKILKYNSGKFENIEDLISIEEPLEISIKFKEKDDWIKRILSITMRTPGDDKDLVRGFLFNEQLIKNIKDTIPLEYKYILKSEKPKLMFWLFVVLRFFD